jgi:hypothetical protein
MILSSLTYGILYLLGSIGLYIYLKIWLLDKRSKGGTDNYDKGSIIPGFWLLIFMSCAMGIYHLFNAFK